MAKSGKEAAVSPCKKEIKELSLLSTRSWSSDSISSEDKFTVRSWKGISFVVVNVVVGVAFLRDATRSPREVVGSKGAVVKEEGVRGFLIAVDGCIRAAKSARVTVGGPCMGVVEGGLGSIVRCRLFFCCCACCNNALSSSSMLYFWL